MAIPASMQESIDLTRLAVACAFLRAWQKGDVSDKLRENTSRWVEGVEGDIARRRQQRKDRGEYV